MRDLLMRPATSSDLGTVFPMRLLVFLLVWLPGGPIRGTEAQVVSAKVLRSSNVRRTDLFCKEEVVMVTSGGQIHSPRYPNAYPRNLLLSWKLVSPPHTRFLLEFDGQFGLEEPENNVCRYDFVEVEDILESSTIIWGRWCGKKVPSPITSKSNRMKITFKSDDFFVAKPGFKLCYTLLSDASPVPNTNRETVTVISDQADRAVTDAPLSAEALDDVIAGFSTVEEVLRHLNPLTWQQDLNSIYTHTHYYLPRSYHLARKNKLDLDRLFEDVKKYSCTPRNFSVNLREELKITNAVFFPRCLLVNRCGGNCGCGTDNWHSCSCSPAKTVNKIHEVLKFSPGANFYRKKTRAGWVLEEIHLQHHERCDLQLPSVSCSSCIFIVLTTKLHLSSLSALHLSDRLLPFMALWD
ncbi:platelet-derived growth factor D isoform X1 [Electrophorus electricus]|uniref:platelet-derived growth factor D isoform X1 n=1 Tax=Electrophorus electricus TaxID=8005 RepID=UPI0015CFC010|nr:platelet-derived growth factor D isoform X1 [Electrophorus electricus]